MKRIYILLFFLVAPLSAGTAQWIKDVKIDALIEKGIKATYNLEFESAEKSFEAVIHSKPNHPAGYFFDAMIDWWRIQITPGDESRDDAFKTKLEKVIEMCEKRLDANERDVTGLFFMGGAIGFRGRLSAKRKDWVAAARDGKRALPIVEDAAEFAPKNADIKLGTGIYNYYADVLPEKYSVLKPFMIFLPDGNRSKGLKQLRDAAEKAKYAKWEAMYFLMQSYTNYENQPSKALTYARELHKEFPKNPVFHRNLGRTYVKLGMWPNASAVYTEISKRSEAGWRGYGKSTLRAAAYYLAYDAMLKKNYSTAMKSFVKCDQISRKIDREGESGFMVMANLRMGMVHDLMKQRSYAVKQYEKVLRMEEFNSSHDLARRYKGKAYKL